MLLGGVDSRNAFRASVASLLATSVSFLRSEFGSGTDAAECHCKRSSCRTISLTIEWPCAATEPGRRARRDQRAASNLRHRSRQPHGPTFIRTCRYQCIIRPHQASRVSAANGYVGRPPSLRAGDWFLWLSSRGTSTESHGARPGNYASGAADPVGASSEASFSSLLAAGPRVSVVRPPGDTDRRGDTSGSVSPRTVSLVQNRPIQNEG